MRRTIDEQRLVRLQQCQQLAYVLKQCQKGQKDRQHLEDFPLGFRSVKYFHWRRPPADDESAPDGLTSDPNCLREQHALWACRAVSLKCGTPLVELRDCFRQHDTASLLKSPGTAYEPNKKGVDTSLIECAAFQQAVGTCVAANAEALFERKEKWEKSN